MITHKNQINTRANPPIQHTNHSFFESIPSTKMLSNATNFHSSSSSSSTPSKPKMLNPKAQEWIPKTLLLPSSPPSHLIIPFPTVTLWFYQALPSLPEPVKPVYSGSVKLVEITTSQEKELEQKKFAQNNTKGQFLKRPKCPWGNHRARKVDTSGTRIFYADPPRFQRRVERSFQHTADRSPKGSCWKPKSTKSCHSGAPPVSQPEVTGNTTVMIKNIPNLIRRDFLLNFLDKKCQEYSLEYDFLYLPMDFRTCDNLGYAFVNFTTAASASTFKNVMQGFKWSSICSERGPIESPKIVNVTWARVQGREGFEKRFQGSIFTCNRLDYLPVLLDPPRDGSDPNPPPPVVIGNLRFRPK